LALFSYLWDRPRVCERAKEELSALVVLIIDATNATVPVPVHQTGPTDQVYSKSGHIVKRAILDAW
jgi:hypothetical protein